MINSVRSDRNKRMGRAIAAGCSASEAKSQATAAVIKDWSAVLRDQPNVTEKRLIRAALEALRKGA